MYFMDNQKFNLSQEIEVHLSENGKNINKAINELYLKAPSAYDDRYLILSLRQSFLKAMTQLAKSFDNQRSNVAEKEEQDDKIDEKAIKAIINLGGDDIIKFYNDFIDLASKNVFKDLFITYKLDTINISTLINTIQLYLNKNYNYCIDYMVSNIYPKLLNTFSYSYLDIDYLSQFIDTNLIHFPKIKHKGYCSECYECGNSHFELNHRGTIAQIEDIINYFHHYKKGNLTKIPKQTL